MTRSYRLLFISDDPSGVEGLAAELAVDGFAIVSHPNDSTALRVAMNESPDIILVDGRRSATSAIQMCHSLRAIEETAGLPLALIAKPNDTRTRVAALEAGADDCLATNLDPREQVLRLRAAARRLEPAFPSELLRYADIELDLQLYKVRRRGTLIPLTNMQTRLLRHLMEHPTLVFSRRELLETVWRDTRLDEGAVTAAVTRLRRLLNSVGGPNAIRSVPGLGYALDVDAGATAGR